MGIDGGRGWKRQRSCEEGKEEKVVGLSGEKFLRLKESLKDVCSLEDLKERMEGHLSRRGCEEVLLIMSRLCKVV